MKKRTIEEINEIYHQSYPNIDVIEFNGYAKKAKLYCNTCELEWERKYGVHNCPQCSKESKKIIYQNRHSEKYKKVLEEKNIELLEEYQNNYTHILHRCKLCGHEWNTTPSIILNTNGVGCPKCANKYKMTHDEFVQEIEEKYPKQFTFHSEFTGLCNPISVTCNCCNEDINKQANSLLRTGCKNCNLTNTNTEAFHKKLDELFDGDITTSDEYYRSNRKMRFHKKSCGHDFLCTPNHLFVRGNCPVCNMSLGETKIFYFLKRHNIDFISQKTYEDLRGIKSGLLPYDFYLPQYNMLIEFQGEQHDHPIKYFGGEEKFKKQKMHDQQKRDYATANHIDLLEIWYWDIKNIDEILKKALGLKLSA